jgi:predicted RNase H-like HicB family nuclease
MRRKVQKFDHAKCVVYTLKIMKLLIIDYIESLLKNAEYEYDKDTQSWCASIEELPGAYAQANSVEEARRQLTEVIEDYILVSLQKGHSLSGFKRLFSRVAQEKIHA